MNARGRKLIGAVALIAFVVVYALLASALAQSRPLQEASVLWRTIGYAVLGLAWTIPAGALIRWMDRPDPSRCAAQTPPVTGTSAPVTAPASRDARNRITAARSPGATHLLKSASGIDVRLAGVSMVDGSTALTVTLRPLNSSARLSVKR